MDPANLLTKRHWIVELARRKPGTVLFSLHHVIDFEWMREAYWLTRKDGATGIDGVTAKEYEANLEANLKDLRERIISGRYKAPPVRRTYIPKADGSQRPLGIPTFEDKVAQRAITMVLEAVYEQDFRSCSYGFRPGCSAHQALQQLSGVITVRRQHWVLDVDIRKYFDSIPHQELRTILDQRVTDGVIRRMIDKWLKAGVLEDGLLRYATEGTPQGGVISPTLSNIFLHHVLDVWFEDEARPRLVGEATLVRFADDFVMTFETHHDAKRVMEVLGKRLGRYGLTLHPDKTRFIDFRPQRRGGTQVDCKDPPFDFLGFTHTWVKSRKGKNVVRQITAKSRLARALLAVKDWCRANRHRPILEQLARLYAKLVGHFAYYGITGNSRRLQQYHHEVMKTWRKWLARRTRSKRLPWDRLNALLARHPLPPARIVHRYAT
ncbi:MAG: group II intron reverse transcriptase/maturase [Bradyrhizobium sp.]|uniref:group II intron reverse transcriptase/maturase n=1 Tax=Bradyrhizobium sp. TaxID=376 RepID=UPI001DD1C874|nr:group II intron reverse transcriptase/maturase [Bradyrhizobium sp.]MBV9561631.1 group II intron reverse transcriptase/maturase [Bradyrhizobium sp.]